ncbi:FG-GAP repeat domain-containing protein [Streptomyces venezuelae]|uniref:FG-GAP repeat domain-containing protein n=1 Tax=Streptomyces venezuelae TaxID=54571 RepID=UPI00278C8FDA|nr:VCBS repeat-containing protein [Streptomyces venezuelae]
MHPPARRRRHTAAVAVVLAVVTAAGLAAPALAAEPVPVATPVAPLALPEGSRNDLTIPADSTLLSAGRTGVLSVTGGSNPVHRWTRFSDGVTTTLPTGSHWGAPGTDTVVARNGAVFTLTDMSGAAGPVVVDTSAFNTDATPYTLVRVVGSTLVMATKVGDAYAYHLVSKEAGQVVDRPVVLPADARPLLNHSTVPGTFVLHYLRVVNGVHTKHVGVVDLATGAVTDSYEAPPTTVTGSTAVTPTHVAWTELPAGGKATLAVARRGGTTVERFPVDSPQGSWSLVLRAVGDWVTYDRDGGSTATWADPAHQLTARSLKTGQTLGLMDHVVSSTTDADGNLLVLGGTLARGEGLYRIAPSADGSPVATLLSGSGRPTALTLTDESLPPGGVVDLDRARGVLKASGRLSRANVRVSLAVIHTASRLIGSTEQVVGTGSTDFALTWNEAFNNGVPAYNGAYSWKLTAHPANGIGPDVVRTGTFTVTRAPKPHDYDDNGSPDVLARDGIGHLRSFDINQINRTPEILRPDPVDLGTGWSTYDRITATGDIAGTTAPDLVARDRTGVLWLYQGNGKGLASRTKVGGGWSIYPTLTAGSDLTGDGRPDLLATDTAGTLWLYKATGDAAAPFAKRVKIGGGWGVFNQLTATGDLGGAAAGDLVARDKAGVLWLYLGKGDGTFAPRTRIGGGWGVYTQLVGVGDVDRDGRNDLIANIANRGPYAELVVYQGTGAWNNPFAPRGFPENPILGEGTIEIS